MTITKMTLNENFKEVSKGFTNFNYIIDKQFNMEFQIKTKIYY